jgi:mono/diheme cytochrome c family protein
MRVVEPSCGGVTYDPARMSRTARYATGLVAAIAVAFAVSACGTNHIGVPKSDPNYAADNQAAQLFNQRCGGCHTLSYAGTHGSAANPRTAEAINGPNFNVRCERPVDRVQYAIANGGFSGAYMPQNIVVGKQAQEVALFVARYAGRQAPAQVGVKPCDQHPIGTLVSATTSTTTTTAAAPVSKATIAAGLSIFKTNCGACHTLAYAGTKGTVGPNLDQLMPNLGTVQHQVTVGGGEMPAFGNKHILKPAQIETVAKFVSSVAGSGTKAP